MLDGSASIRSVSVTDSVGHRCCRRAVRLCDVLVAGKHVCIVGCRADRMVECYSLRFRNVDGLECCVVDASHSGTAVVRDVGKVGCAAPIWRLWRDGHGMLLCAGAVEVAAVVHFGRDTQGLVVRCRCSRCRRCCASAFHNVPDGC